MKKARTNFLFAACVTLSVASFADETSTFVPLDAATPLYEIDVSTETDLATWMSEHEVASLSGGGTIVKKGSGKLKITTDALSGFTGAFYICRDSVVEASITKPFGNATNWVENGAAIVLDTAAYTTYKSFVFGGKRLYFEGTGVDGTGAVVYKNVKENYFDGLGPAPTLTGNARVKIPTKRHDFDASTHFHLNGHKLTFDVQNICFGGFTIEPGHIEIASGQVICQGTMTFKGGPENTFSFLGGNQQWWGMNSASKCDWTLVTQGRTHQAGNGGRDGSANIWYGPVRLTGTPTMTSYNNNSAQTWAGQVSGSFGIKVSGNNPASYSYGLNPGLYLSCPTNTFTGGVTVSKAILHLTVDGALPSAPGSGKLTMTDSALDLPDVKPYALPMVEFSGTGVVQGASGAWKGNVVKKAAGELVYRSQVGGELLDIQGGCVRLDLSNTGLWEYVLHSKESARSFYDGSEAPEQIYKDWPDMMYSNVYSTPKRWDDYTTLVYSGYIWNKTDADVTWTFAQCYDDDSTLYINGVKVCRQEGYQTVTATPVVLHPGANRFMLRVFNTTGGGGASTYKPTGASATWQAKALSYHIGETTSKDMADYTAFTRESVAEYFTPTLGTVDGVQKILPHFTKVKLAAGTTFDTAGFPYRLAEVEGVGSFTNGSVIVTNGYLIAAADVNAGRKLSVTGKLTFAEGATVDIAGDVDVTDRNVLRHQPKGVVIVTATEGIDGLPAVTDRLKAAHWETRLTADGKSLELVYVNGLMVFLR